MTDPKRPALVKFSWSLSEIIEDANRRGTQKELDGHALRLARAWERQAFEMVREIDGYGKERVGT